MPKTIQLDGVGLVEVPDEATPEQLDHIAKQEFLRADLAGMRGEPMSARILNGLVSAGDGIQKGFQKAEWALVGGTKALVNDVAEAVLPLTPYALTQDEELALLGELPGDGETNLQAWWRGAQASQLPTAQKLAALREDGYQPGFWGGVAQKVSEAGADLLPRLLVLKGAGAGLGAAGVGGGALSGVAGLSARGVASAAAASTPAAAVFGTSEEGLNAKGAITGPMYGPVQHLGKLTGAAVSAKLGGKALPSAAQKAIEEAAGIGSMWSFTEAMDSPQAVRDYHEDPKKFWEDRAANAVVNTMFLLHTAPTWGKDTPSLTSQSRLEAIKLPSLKPQIGAKQPFDAAAAEAARQARVAASRGEPVPPQPDAPAEGDLLSGGSIQLAPVMPPQPNHAPQQQQQQDQIGDARRLALVAAIGNRVAEIPAEVAGPDGSLLEVAGYAQRQDGVWIPKTALDQPATLNLQPTTLKEVIPNAQEEVQRRQETLLDQQAVSSQPSAISPEVPADSSQPIADGSQLNAGAVKSKLPTPGAGGQPSGNSGELSFAPVESPAAPAPTATNPQSSIRNPQSPPPSALPPMPGSATPATITGSNVRKGTEMPAEAGATPAPEKVAGNTYFQAGTSQIRGGIQWIADDANVASAFAEGGQFGRPGAKVRALKAALNVYDQRTGPSLMSKSELSYTEPDGLINWTALEGNEGLMRRLKEAGYDAIRISEGTLGESIAVLPHAVSKLKPSSLAEAGATPAPEKIKQPWEMTQRDYITSEMRKEPALRFKTDRELEEDHPTLWRIARQEYERLVEKRAQTTPRSALPAPRSEISAEAGATPAPEKPATTTLEADQFPVSNVAVRDIHLSKDVPNFKGNADPKTGVVAGQELEGDFDPLTAPIVVWRRKGGRLEVITGRHRLDLARRSGTKTIKAFVVDESPKFNKDWALSFDALSNIRDGQGTIEDYAHYFKTSSNLTEAEARKAGLLARVRGRAGWHLGKNSDPNLYALWRAGKITDAQAATIAEAAPGDSGLQSVGSRYALAGKPPEFLKNIIQAARQESGQRGQPLDLFGADDSAMRDMEARAERASAIQRNLRDQVLAVQGAAKRPEVARQMGVDVNDPDAIQARIGAIRAELSRWENWPLHQDLVARVKGTPAAAPDFTLNRPESIEEQQARLAAEEAVRAGQAAKDKLAEQAARKLTGTAGDLGQGDLLAEPEDLFAPPKPGRGTQASPPVEGGGELGGAALTSDAARMAELRSMAPVEITGGPTTIETARSEFQRLLPKMARIAKEAGRLVRFVMTGFNKTASHSADDRVLRVIPQLPELLSRSIRIETEQPRDTSKPNVRAYHTYAVRARMDGRDQYVAITVREQTDGNFYYDNHVTSSAALERGPQDQPDSLAMRGEDPASLAKNHLYRWWQKVKGQTTTQASPPVLGGGELGGTPPPTTPEMDPRHSVFDAVPMEMPEAVQVIKQLTGEYPKIKERLRALGGNAAGVFRHGEGEGSTGRVELRAGIFDLLTAADKAKLRAEADAYAKMEAPNDRREQAKISEDFYQHKLAEAYEEAKTRNPVQALKVVWHEIGHVVDWLPDKIISGRGNIFGRLGSLKQQLKQTFPIDPTRPAGKPLKPSDLAKLRREAADAVQAEIGPMREIIETIFVEEPIYRESGVTPDMVKRLFTSNDARESMPELYSWFASQDAAVKKEIIRAAMKGILDERISQAGVGGREQIGTKRVEKTVRRREGRMPTPAEIEAKFKTLLRAEMLKRNLADLAQIKAEMEPVIAWWRGTEKMEDYFRPSEEMYAEAFSVFANNPAALSARAPTYARMLWNYLGRKPQVRALYDEIQADIKAGRIMPNRVRTLRGMFEDDARRSLDLERMRHKLTGRDFLDNVAYHIDRRFGPVYRLTRGYAREGAVREAIGSFLYRQTEHERFLGNLNDAVSKPMVRQNLDWADLGEYLFHRRVSQERFNMANPLGWTSKNSLERLGEMQRELGPERWAALEQAGQEFRRIYADQVTTPMGRERMFTPETQKILDERAHYATFSALKGVPDTGIEGILATQYGASVTPHIYRQIGMTGEIKNPATATVLKGLSMISSAARNTAKREISELIRSQDRENWAKAKFRFNGRRLEPVIVETPKVGTLVWLEDGEVKAAYVRRHVADAINGGSPTENLLFAGLHSATGWMKGLFTQLNYAFWPVNYVRDTMGWMMQVPGGGPVAYAKVLPKALAAARASVTRAKPNPLAEAALRRRMVISQNDPRGVFAAADNEFELQVARMGMDPAAWNKAADRVHLLAKAWQHYREFGQTFERVNKLAGMIHLDEKFPNLPEWKKREIVRERAGSPNFLERGASNPYVDMFMLFYNPWKEGARSVAKSAAENPLAFGAKAGIAILLPTIFQAAAVNGWLGDDWKKRYRSVANYDLTNYLVPPPKWADEPNLKVAYLRLPLWEPARLAHGILFQLLTQRGQGVTSFAGGQLPGLNPLLKTAVQWGYYAQGINPPDFYRGVGVLSQKQQDARAETWDGFQQMLQNTWNNAGGSVLFRFQNPNLESPPQSEAEKFLRWPGVNNLLGRWIKVSDRGQAEALQAEGGEAIRAHRSALQLAVEPIVAKVAAGTALADSERQLLLRDSYALEYFARKLIETKTAQASPIFRLLDDARSTQERIDMLQHLAEQARKANPPGK